MTEEASFGVVPVYKTENGFEFLLTQHSSGHWGFPKGHAEGDESPLAAAQREFEEETGITSYQLIEDEIFTEEYFPPTQKEVIHKTVKYYLGFISDQHVVPQDEEVLDYVWLEYRPAMNKLTYAGAKKILRSVKDVLEKKFLV